MLRRSSAPTLVKSSALQKRVERVAAFEAAPQNFVVRQPFFSPSFKDAIDPNAFRPLKFFVLEIGIVNHLRDFPDSLIADPEALRERLEGAVVADVGKLGIEHVEGNRVRSRRNLASKREARLRIDELPNQPGRADPIDLRPRPGEPGSAAVISWTNLDRLAPGRAVVFEFLQLHLDL